MVKLPSGATPEERLSNTLKWIRLTAALHYFGGAFEPEHMRVLANMASDALAGKELPDFEDAMAEGKRKASEWAERLGIELTGDDEDGDG